MERVAGYLGMCGSSDERKEKMGKIGEYCARNDLKVSEWLEGKEYEKFGKVAYGKWLNGRKVDAVVVPDVAEVSVNVYEFYGYKAVLKRRHSDLVVADERNPFGAYGPYRKVFDELIDTMCRLDMENEPIRTNNGRIDKASKGAYIGGRPPMGYMVRDGKLVVNKKEVPVVLFVMERKLAGKTMLGTMEEMNAKGFRTRSGKDFVISTVQSIWKNEMFYRGYYRYGKDGEWVKGQHEAILK